jgi:gluconokinase
VRVLAIDVGTSSTRAIAFDEDGRPVGHDGRVEYEASAGADGAVELDPDQLVEAVTTAVDECLAEAGRGEPAVDAVGISAFWHGLLALDDGGRPLSPVITWADTRSAGAAAALRASLDEETVRRRTGAPLHAAFFPAKLRWLREAHPNVFARTHRWSGFAEYLLERLTGQWRTSLSMASGTGLLDQDARRWDPGMLDVVRIPADRLPPIDDDAVTPLAPRWAGRWPRLARARWLPAWGDGACSNIGSGCADATRIALNVGTSAALRLVTEAAVVPPPGLWRYRVDGTRSIVGGATSEGGNVVAWCRRILALGEDNEVDRALADLAPDGHGLVALPFIAGERSPGWRDDARAALTGLRLGTSPVEILRALMEAVAYRLALIHERLAPLAAPGHALVASGGALLHSPVWTGIVADALGVPMTLSSETEASSRGAAILALGALGHAIPPGPLEGTLVTPDAGRHEIYRRALERQARLYETVVTPREVLRE